MSEAFPSLNRVSSTSVKKHTKKNWDQWVQILNDSGGKNWDHRQLVDFLKRKHKLNAWWQQGVAIGYEIAIGKRVEGRNLKGEYSTTSSKTYSVDVKTLWKWVSSPEGISVWLKPLSEFKLKPKNMFETESGYFGQVRTMKAGLRVRMSWQDPDWSKPSIIQLWFIARPGKKSILVFTHDQIRESRVRTEMKSYWKQILDEIQEALKARKS